MYTPTASKIILAAKENGLQGADDLLIAAIVHVLSKARLDSGYFTLVPVPSSKRSQRRRGRSFVVDLTKAISKHTGIAVNDCLQVSRRVSDQSGLTRIQRSSNMHGAFSVKPGAILRGVFMPSAQLARLPPVWLSLYDKGVKRCSTPIQGQLGSHDER
jgi:predicted amidophosphoribosyltransferase